MDKIKYNCVFGGGGIRSMCYIGVLKAMKECGIVPSAIAGSSAGAVFAALYAAKFSAEEIKKLFLEFNFNMFRDININIFNPDISLSKGDIFYGWLQEKISKKIFGKNIPVRFKDIEKDLQILTVDINTNTPYIFSKDTTPDTEVALAVRASAGLPGLMKPVNIADAVLVDGDLIKSRAAWQIYESFNNPHSRLLEFRLEGSRNGNGIKNPIDYVNSIINTVWYFSTENIFNAYHNNDRYDYIIIDTKDIILFNFNIDRSMKELLIDKGYKAAKEYFSSTLVNKKKQILPVYKNISEKLALFNILLSKKKINNALYIINDILSNMYEYTKYIDISIYEEIKELKEAVLKNIKTHFSFVQKMENESLIKKKSEFIIMLINERIIDLEDYIKIYCNNC